MYYDLDLKQQRDRLTADVRELMQTALDQVRAMPPMQRLIKRVTWADWQPFDANRFPGLMCYWDKSLDGIQDGGLGVDPVFYKGYRFRYPPYFAFKPHYHTYAERVRVRRGRMRFLVSGVESYLVKGDLLHIDPEMVHDFVCLTEETEAEVYFASDDIEILPNGKNPD